MLNYLIAYKDKYGKDYNFPVGKPTISIVG